ncbi:MAG: helix-turn-helix transcriptional regulator [Clostridia bacterium]|nr:helix-turn-helix transcriptional regulator [Clostridia bacterium]
MTVNDAVVKRTIELLKEKNISQYRLEQLSGIQHGHMQWIMSGKSKTVTLSTVLRLANGFGMTVTEFLGGDLFLFENLEVE